MTKQREQLRAGGSRQARRSRRADLLAGLPDAVPGFVPPMQCRLVDRLPSGKQWAYELKLDGYRALAIKSGSRVQLISRNRKELSSDYPEIIQDIRLLPMTEGVLDGEIVALDASGKPCFQDLQHAHAPGRGARRILYFAFDLLNLEGKALLSLPLVDRKRMLEEVLRSPPAQVRFLPFLEGAPDEILRAIARESLEGIVAKTGNSQYEAGKRTGAWTKLKIGLEQDFVVGGYTRGQGGRAAFGALIVGYYDQGKFRYASKVGTGFSNLQIRQLLEKSGELQQPHSPFDGLPETKSSPWSYGLTAAERKTAVWLKPVLVCRVRFTEWTQDGHLRHPAFEGWRADQEASEVARELQNPSRR